MLVWTQIVLRRLMTLKIPYDKLPMSQMDHRNSIFTLLMQIAFITLKVVLERFPKVFNYLDVISIVMFLLTLMICLSKLMVVPIFNKTINIVVNLNHWMTLSCSFIILINAFDSNIDTLNLYYLAILVPFMIAIAFLIEYHWQFRILEKIRQSSNKMEVQSQYILYLL